ncbi:MAG: hypothetical protein WCK86_16210 [Planctomycetia bacterium]
MLFRDVCNPVRVGAGLRANSGGGAALATGYFLAALQAETRTLDAMQIDAVPHWTLALTSVL